MQAELWFEMSKSDPEDDEPAELQLCTLNEAAAAMSRASVTKSGQMSRNRHPDYEFFLSRYR
nr:unnamed protein product [Digitaria exilis]